MKKNTQVVLAGAVVLGLAAGGGTFALWNSEASLDGGGVTTGKLHVAAGEVDYKDVSEDATNDSWDADTDRIVPGDTIQSEQAITLTLVGKNLKADLSLTGNGSSLAVIDPAIADDLVISFAAVPAGSTPSAADWKPVSSTVTLASELEPSSTSDTADYTVFVRYAFDLGAGNLDSATTADQANKVAKLIDGAKVSLTQVR